MRKLLILTLFTLFVSSNLLAGWKIIIHQNTNGIQQVVTYYITKSGMKISTDEFDFIYFKTDQKVIIVNHKTRSVFMGSFAEYEQQLKDLMSIDKKRADAVLPKSYFQLFDELLAQNISDYKDDNIRTTPSLTVENTDDERRIAEYTSTEYKIYFDTVLIERIWFSDLGVRNEFDIFECFNFFRGIKNTNLKQSKNMNTQEYEQLIYRGFPLKIANLDNFGYPVFKSEVVQAQEIEVSEEETFGPPKDYQTRTLVDIIMAKD
jgi:hypothetical protein